MIRRDLICAAFLALLPLTGYGQQAGRDLESMSLEQLMNVKVEGAAMHPQTLQDAPASVTVITAEDIATYGYRTLGEALSSVRGFYSSNTYTYESIGVRGFNSPGDYASRIIVMVNGHNMADNVFGFMLLFGEGFPIDLNLIRQIEIIRGPSSALYGTNGIFATINIVTKNPGAEPGVSAAFRTGSFGEKKGEVTGSGRMGPVSFLSSLSVFNDAGAGALYFPEFDSPATNHGVAANMNGEHGFAFFSSLSWTNWTITAAAGKRTDIQPISWGDVVFNDRGTKVVDTRDYIEAVYARPLGEGTLRWRTYYDSYTTFSREDLPANPALLGAAGIEDNRMLIDGKWVGTEVSYRFDLPYLGTLTVGSEGKIDLLAQQINEDVAPRPVQYLYTDDPDRQFAVFVQDERRLAARWTLDLGLRYDYSALRANFLSPRAALIYQPSAWTYKFLYGRAFRNPSDFELFYGDGLTADANPHARPEKADTVELDLERKIRKRLTFSSAAYVYRLHDFLEPRRAANGLIQYENVGHLSAVGLELELSGRPTSWLEATASYSWQRVTDDIEHSPIEDSPMHLAKVRFSMPLGRKFKLSSGMQYYSARLTLAGAWTTPLYLADFTLTSRKLTRNFDFQCGIRNAFNRTYSDPVALTPLVDTMRQPGRSFYVEFIAHRNQEVDSKHAAH